MLRRNPNGEDNVRAFVDLGTCWGRAFVEIDLGTVGSFHGRSHMTYVC